MHGEHDAHLRSRDLGQARDLADGVHAHLEHGRLVRGSSRSSVIGSPVSEFRLPSLRSVVRLRDRTSAVISLAIVLPVEPVMPTTRTAWRPPPRGRSWSARSASGDDTWAPGEVGGELHRSLDERGHRAGSERIGHEGVPVHPLTGRATKMDPGVARRESTDAPVIEVEAVGGGPLQPAAGGGEQVLEADRGRHTHPAADFGRV